LSNLQREDILRAHARIRPIAQQTPLLEDSKLSRRLHKRIMLKLENLQPTGSFKIRGAANKISNLTKIEQERGVIAVSSGNHGRAVAYVAQELGLRAVICLSEATSPAKIRAIQALCPKVIIKGKTYDEATLHALQMQQERGLTMIHPFDDPLVIAGQGTIGLELMQEMPQIDTLIVPLSGGGLLGGIAFMLKTSGIGAHVVGATMERGAAMVASLKAGKPVDVAEQATLADALVGGIGLQNHYTFNLIQHYVDETVLVSEDEIASAMLYALDALHLLVEGGGAVGLAALLHGRIREIGKQVAVVLSGGNVDMPLLCRLHAQRSARCSSLDAD
jgi:threonine dehydratase